jgi:hypothetical protein
LGPAVEVQVLPGFAVEVDGLYRPFGYTLEFNYASASFETTRERANSWEFPLIAKYRFFERSLRPFVGVGYAVRTVRGTDAYSGFSLRSLNPQVYQYYTGRANTAYSATHGLVVSGGIDFGTKRLGIPLEFRYEHWTQPFLDQYGGDGSYHIQSAQNEAFVMLGLMWR